MLQVLHYKVDSMQEKVAYLRSIGMSPSQVGVVLQVGRHSSTNHKAPCPCLCTDGATCWWTTADRHRRTDSGAFVLLPQRLPQLLSLDVRNNLVPKYRYLQAELGGDVDTVANYPAYFSLSLPLRCAGFPICGQTISATLVVRHAA
jgi:hypothetical protein